MEQMEKAKYTVKVVRASDYFQEMRAYRRVHDPKGSGLLVSVCSQSFGSMRKMVDRHVVADGWQPVMMCLADPPVYQMNRCLMVKTQDITVPYEIV